ncbi:MAG: hypothetical protein M1813_001353 [Trichoglossum hirsutum]|nr:MAG: hypothetical protein M1813_001353 [Trichoglossum hirsutum]
MDSRDVLEGITVFTFEGGSLHVTAKLDSTAQVGIIKRSIANETGYGIAGIEGSRNAIMDSAGIPYGPVGQIELRYHKRRGSRSQEERFYVVEDDARFMDTSYDVILGVTSHLCRRDSGGHLLLPIGLEPQSQGDRQRQEQLKIEAEMQRKVDEKMMEDQEAIMRGQ